jgi:UDP-N-acetyl-D-mannosaminuronic acid dehydrogenase
MVVIMVGHNEIKENMEKLNGKVVFDTRNICVLSGVYRL